MARDRFFSAIEKIYGAALAPETWPAALDGVTRLLGASHARLWIEQDGRVKHWDDQGESPALASISEILHERSKAPHRSGSVAFVSRSEIANAVLVVYRGNNRSPAADTALVRQLTKHLELALKLAHRLSQASALETETACMVEHLGARFQFSDARDEPERFAFAGPASISVADRASMIVRTGLLHELYALTAAESHLCNALLRASGLRAAAFSLGISVNTAKTQLQAIFQKTGVSRQSELLRLLLDGPGFLCSATAAANDLQHE